MALQPVAVADGFVELWFTRYPVTPTLSEAVKEDIGTFSEVAVDGMVKESTVGGVVSVVVPPPPLVAG